MGRELKRVAFDFDWPLNRVWKGYLNPYYQYCIDCSYCDGSGLNRETKKIHDDWYDFANTGRKWCHDIRQDEVQALLDHGRLKDFTDTFIPGEGWVKKDPPYIPTAKEINEWSKKGIGHDSINHWICVKARAERLGVYGKCKICKGTGSIWASLKYRILSNLWKKKEPPSGKGYQIWETVSEGSPVSPVFKTPDELALWMIDNDHSVTNGTTYAQWMSFINGPGWAPSFVGTSGKLKPGVQGVE